MAKKEKKKKTKHFSLAAAICSGVFLALTIGMFIAGNFALQNEGAINMFFGCKTSEIIPKPKDPDDDDDDVDTQYYKPKFKTADGKADTAALLQYDRAASEEIVSEGVVLFWNKNNALPIAKSNAIHLFGTRSAILAYGTHGSGGVDERMYEHNKVTYQQAFERAGYTVNGTLVNYFKTHLNTNTAGSDITPVFPQWGSPHLVLEQQYDGSCDASINGGYGIIVLNRRGSEGFDGKRNNLEGVAGQSWTALTKEEKANINKVIALKNNGKLSKVVVLLACNENSLQMDELSTYSGIDACMWIGHGGTGGPDGVVNVLSGNVAPSGHLTDTWLYNALAAPSSQNSTDLYTKIEFGNQSAFSGNAKYQKLKSEQGDNDSQEKNLRYVVYQENIYVGYKYFETRYEDTILGNGSASSSKGSVHGAGNWKWQNEVAYPFGFGSSYTTFKHSDFTCTEQENSFLITTKVTNTGNYAGKDVVQAYVQKPYTDFDKTNHIEQAAVNLVGFKKTDTLAPGASEVVEIEVSKDELKTYDSYVNKTYIFEKGTYYLTTGEDAHDAINNILAKKGKSTAQGMTKDGDATKVFEYNDTVGSTGKYKSPYTEKEVSNQFDNADINLVKSKYGESFGSVTYLSRNNWDATYPTSIVQLNLTAALIDDLMWGKAFQEEPGAKMPTYGKNSGVSLYDAYKNSLDKLVPYDDPIWDKILDQTTWDEQMAVMIGCICNLKPVASVKSPGLQNYDCPAGLNNPFQSKPMGHGFCYPDENLLACTYDRDLATKMGECLGEDNLAFGVTYLYAPGNNIHRTPYSGRNGEYYSEDGYMCGEMLWAEVKGLQSNGAGAQAKHFALNDQETDRNGGCVFANEQSIREVYLKGYEKACSPKQDNSQILSLMGGFNRIGALWTGAHKGLATGILRDEWGFLGWYSTDGNGYNLMTEAHQDGILAGTDAWMGGDHPDNFKALKNSPTICTHMRESVHRILYANSRTWAVNGLSSDNSSIIIILTPWWKTALFSIQYSLIALTCISGALLIASIIVPIVKKKHAVAIEGLVEGGLTLEDAKLVVSKRFKANGKKIAIGSACAIVTAGIIIGICFGVKACTAKRPDFTLSGGNAPCALTTNPVDVLTNKIGDTTYLYEGAAKYDGGHVTLFRNGAITPDQTRPIKTIKANFDGGLVLKTGNTPGIYDTSYILRNGAELKVCGKYWSIEANKKSKIVSIDIDYDTKEHMHHYIHNGKNFICSECDNVRDAGNYFPLFDYKSSIALNKASFINVGKGKAIDLRTSSDVNYEKGNSFNLTISRSEWDVEKRIILGISNTVTNGDHKVKDFLKVKVNGYSVIMDENALIPNHSDAEATDYFDVDIGKFVIPKEFNKSTNTSIEVSYNSDNQLPFTIGYIAFEDIGGVTFEAEDATMVITQNPGTATNQITVERPRGLVSNGKSTAAGAAHAGDYIKFDVYAPAPIVTPLDIYINRNQNITFEQAYTFKVNNVQKTIGQVSKLGDNEGISWWDFRAPVTTEVSLNQGWNQLTFTIVKENDCMTNLDKLVFRPVNGVIYGAGHTLEAESAKRTPAIKADSTETLSTENTDYSSGGTNLSHMGVGTDEAGAPAGDKVEFKFYATSACEAYIGIDYNCSKPNDIDDYSRTTFNDNGIINFEPNTRQYPKDGEVPFHSDYWEFGHVMKTATPVTLKAGLNRFTFTMQNGNHPVNLDRLVIYPASK